MFVKQGDYYFLAVLIKHQKSFIFPPPIQEIHDNPVSIPSLTAHKLRKKVTYQKQSVPR